MLLLGWELSMINRCPTVSPPVVLLIHLTVSSTETSLFYFTLLQPTGSGSEYSPT
jgi:hypothetical protein